MLIRVGLEARDGAARDEHSIRGACEEVVGLKHRRTIVHTAGEPGQRERQVFGHPSRPIALPRSFTSASSASSACGRST
jgi:hypothetical protein